jgi:exopolysaccharide production protein ExoZ
MYKSLQACRGLAALMVVFYHARGAISQPKYFGESVLGNAFIFGGSAGVDFFFVLSGFIIFWIHAKDIGQPKRLGSYLAKRAIRIYPTYWTIFAVVCCAALAVPALRQTVPGDPWTLLKALLLVPIDPATPGVTATGAPVLTVAWSLQFEVMFYLFVALAIIAPRACLLVAALWVFNFFTCRTVCSFPLGFFADYRILLFALGGATAWLCRRTVASGAAATLPAAVARGGWRVGPWTDRLSLMLGVSILVAAATLHTLGLMDAGVVRQESLISLYGLASALIIFGVVKAEDRGAVHGAHAGWQVLGAASYALYLLHYPLISVVMKLMMVLGLRGLGGALFALAVAVSVSVAAAVLFHLHVERPMLRTLGAWRWPALRAAGSPRV